MLSDREQWAEDHGYHSYTCRIHGHFWSDSGEGCPYCDDEPRCKECRDYGFVKDQADEVMPCPKCNPDGQDDEESGF